MPKKRILTPKRKTIERLEEEQDKRMRLKRVRDMLEEIQSSDEDEVTIEETNRVLLEAGFNPEEIRSFARRLVAQETPPFTLPAESPAHYKAVSAEVDACVAKLKKAGANRWIIQQALEGRAEELITERHEERRSRYAEAANRETDPNGEEETED